MPRVAILGAGPSGLVSAKSALEYGLEPIIFEQASELGGLWRPVQGRTWKSMHTNLSHFSCMFSDFPWEENTEDFPTQQQMHEYLLKYADHFNIKACIQFNSKVINVNKNFKGWDVTWSTPTAERKEFFDFVIIATGIFSKAHTPSFPYQVDFKGTVEHSQQYKSPEKYKDQQVVVVGGAYSGAEIAAEIASYAKSVTNIISAPFWILPRYIPKDLNKPESRFPLDLVFYNRASRPKSTYPPLTAADAALLAKTGNARKNTYFFKIANGDQSAINIDLRMDPNSQEPTRVIISDNYLEQIKNGKILIKKGNIKQFIQNGLVFDDGTIQQADVIVLATGYQLMLPFFDESIKTSLSYKETDQLQPILLHKCTFHPELQNMAFVGMYRGPYFAIMELQAIWSMMVFSGKIASPSLEVMKEGIKEEFKIREQNPRPQFPHGDYIGFADSIAQEIGMPKDLETLKAKNAEIYKVISEGPVVPAHFRFFRSTDETALAAALTQSQRAALRLTEEIPKPTKTL